MAERRLRRYAITPEWLARQLTSANHIGFVVTEGLPETARLVNYFAEPQSGLLWLVFEDRSFDPVQEGQLIPVGHVEWEAYVELDP